MVSIVKPFTKLSIEVYVWSHKNDIDQRWGTSDPQVNYGPQKNSIQVRSPPKRVVKLYYILFVVLIN